MLPTWAIRTSAFASFTGFEAAIGDANAWSRTISHPAMTAFSSRRRSNGIVASVTTFAASGENNRGWDSDEGDKAMNGEGGAKEEGGKKHGSVRGGWFQEWLGKRRLQYLLLEFGVMRIVIWYVAEAHMGQNEVALHSKCLFLFEVVLLEVQISVGMKVACAMRGWKQSKSTP